LIDKRSTSHFVIASEAKQSRKPRSTDWIASELTLLAMTDIKIVMAGLVPAMTKIQAVRLDGSWPYATAAGGIANTE
jgi:hypothetical protein